MFTSRFASMLLALPLLVTSACTTMYVAKRPIPAPDSVRSQVFFHKEFRLAVFDFPGDPEKEMWGLRQSVPAMLTTALKDLKNVSTESGDLVESRFSVYSGGDPRISRDNTEELTGDQVQIVVDGYVSGAITRADSSEVCFVTYLHSAYTQELLWSDEVCSRLEGEEVRRPSERVVERLASNLSRTLPQIALANVVSAESGTFGEQVGHFVEIDKGARHAVKRGMVAYAVAASEAVPTEGIGDRVQAFTGQNVAAGQGGALAEGPVVALLYVVSVEEERSVARVYSGSHLFPGDKVFFK